MKARRPATADAPQWDGNRRRDGLLVARGIDGNWVIVHGLISCCECPCCGTFLFSDRQARLVADMVYPIERVAA